MSSPLALLGGSPVRQGCFPAYRVIDDRELEAVTAVVRSGVLSRFLGVWHDDFNGGPEVRALEAEWAAFFDVKHAISVNSATSGLYAAIGAAGIGPGDEVIVSPYTMSASATSILVFNGVPVFADVEPDCFCLSPESVREKITPRTKAIMVVDIFGQPYDAEALNAIAREHGLIVIEDTAQAPAAKYKGQWAGSLGDIGVFSLNYHKHIHCGEGGVVVTNDDDLADRVRLIRNHAESVVEAKGTANLVNMIGFNFRMTEIEASISRQQLKKLKGLVDRRRENVAYLNDRLQEVPCLELPKERDDCEHAYYVHALKYRSDVAGLPRKRFVEALRAELAPIELREGEGVPVGEGYVKPLYLTPLYQTLTGYGDRGCPFRCPWYEGQLNYAKGLCPTVEWLHEEGLIGHEFIRPPMTRDDLDDVADAFTKVWDHRAELR